MEKSERKNILAVGYHGLLNAMKRRFLRITHEKPAVEFKVFDAEPRVV